MSHNTLWTGFLLTTSIMALTIARILKNQNKMCVTAIINVRFTIYDTRPPIFGCASQLVKILFTLRVPYFPLAFAYSSGCVFGLGISNSSFPYINDFLE